MNRFSQFVAYSLFAIVCLLPALAAGQTLNLNNKVQSFSTLVSTTVTMTGRSELRITGTGDPISGSVINLNSSDAWFLMTNIAPSTVASTFLSRVKVNGTAAVADSNCRVVEYGQGAVIIPQGPTFSPMTVYDGKCFTGISKSLQSYTAYNINTLSPLTASISSFKLKRGYTATVAQNENGTGTSKNYVAADGDLEVSALPASLDNQIRFVRIFPWRWVTKKGSCDIDPVAVNAKWHYNWNISTNSTKDWEYVAIKHQPYWPGLNQDWQARGINHLLGYNEPNNPVEDSYKNLSPQGSVSDAVVRLPELLGTGLRLGSPAVTDGGYSWIVDFVNQADAAGYRLDYVPVHYYRSYPNNNNPQGAATNLYNFLKSIHDATKRPIWVTEFNNGANWTGDADPTFDQNKNVIEAMINMMDSTPWIERYSVYSAVEEVRQVYYNAGGFTPMGAMYRDHVAPIAYQQVLSEAGIAPAAIYAFNGDLRDSLANGNDVMAIGAPNFVAGKYGQAIALDGASDYLQVSTGVGDATDFTFAGWVKWNGGNDWQRIFDFGDDTSHYMFLSPRSSGGNLRFAINTGSGEQQLSAPALTAGAWTHIAVTISGSTGKLFVNGVLTATNTGMTYNPVDIGTRLNYIGKSQFAADPLFNGQLDDLRFYGTALTDAQVTVIATNAPPTFNANPIALSATTFQQFSSTIASNVTGGSGTRTFSKISGPGWLAVAANGTLIGVPSAADRGLEKVFVRVTDANGAIDTTTLQINVQDPAGLVARYAFNGNANATEGAPNGITSGAVSYGAGVSGQAIYLNGTDSSISLPGDVASSDEVTVTTWFWVNSTATWQRIFDFGSGTAESMFLTPRSSAGTLRFSIYNSAVTQNLNAPAPATNQWIHVAVTLGANVGKLYINGALTDTQAITLKPTDLALDFNYLGKSQWPDPLFNGRLDEFLVFNQALSAAQVAALANKANHPPVFAANPIVAPAATAGQIYEETIASIASDVDAGNTLTFSKVSGPEWLTVSADGRISGVPPAGEGGLNRFIVRVTDPTMLATDTTLNISVSEPVDLIAHYSFNGNTADSKGGSPATLAGASAYVASSFDNAVSLDGSTNYLQLPNAPIATLTNFTIAAKVRWNGGSNWQRIFDFGNNTAQYLYLTSQSPTGRVRFAITNSGNAGEQALEASSPLLAGDWAHVAVTLAGTTGTLYVNGAAVASGTITLKPSTFSPTLNYIGKSQWPDPLFNGAIDDFRIYNRGLPSAEVATLAVPAAGVTVPDSSYAAWSATYAFPGGESDALSDPDQDGFINAWEYLFGSNPLSQSSGMSPTMQSMSASALGLPGEKTYLTLQARLRKQRLGATLIPEAAASIADLTDPSAATHAKQAGTPIIDGSFEIITYYYDVPIEDSPTGTGMIRLRVMWQ